MQHGKVRGRLTVAKLSKTKLINKLRGNCFLSAKKRNERLVHPLKQKQEHLILLTVSK